MFLNPEKNHPHQLIQRSPSLQQPRDPKLIRKDIIYSLLCSYQANIVSAPSLKRRHKLGCKFRATIINLRSQGLQETWDTPYKLLGKTCGQEITSDRVCANSFSLAAKDSCVSARLQTLYAPTAVPDCSDIINWIISPSLNKTPAESKKFTPLEMQEIIVK